MTKEEIYDQQINPLMKQIIQICKDHRIGLHSTFFTDLNEAVTTHLPYEGDQVVLAMLSIACMGRNFDAFCISLLRYLRNNGINLNSSIALTALEKAGF